MQPPLQRSTVALPPPPAISAVLQATLHKKELNRLKQREEFGRKTAAVQEMERCGAADPPFLTPCGLGVAWPWTVAAVERGFEERRTCPMRRLRRAFETEGVFMERRSGVHKIKSSPTAIGWSVGAQPPPVGRLAHNRRRSAQKGRHNVRWTPSEETTLCA